MALDTVKSKTRGLRDINKDIVENMLRNASKDMEKKYGLHEEALMLEYEVSLSEIQDRNEMRRMVWRNASIELKRIFISLRSVEWVISDVVDMLEQELESTKRFITNKERLLKYLVRKEEMEKKVSSRGASNAGDKERVILVSNKRLRNEREEESFESKRICIEDLEAKFPEVFRMDEEKVKFCEVEECSIRTKPGEMVVKRGQRVPQKMRLKTKEYLRRLEKRGIIRRSSSQWRNPIRVLEKPNGDVRLVSNLMALNDLTEKDSQTLPVMKRIIESTQGSERFTVIDLKEGYYQVAIKEEDRYKTAFEFEDEVWEWCGMVMGFKNAPMIFQRVMNTILGDWIGKGVEVYMDDIIVHGKTQKEHDDLLYKVLKKLRDNNLRINKNKMQFNQGEVKLLGVSINGKEQIPLEIKKNEALEYPRPKTVAELRRFLGLTGWFREFIKDYARITISLFDGLKGNKGLVWTDKMEIEFNKLKEVLRNAKSLRLPDFNKMFILKTDASDTGLGAVLLQVNEKGEQVPVQWASKKLTPTERRYGITEKEMYAVVWGIEKFEYELRGRKFHLITDHKALEEIRRKPYFENNRVNRWVEKIMEYDFTIQYSKGETLVIADALSRLHEEECKEEVKDLKSEKMEQRVKKRSESIWKEHVVEKDGLNYWRFDSGEMRLIPDENVREEIILNIHEVLKHRGTEAVYYKVKQDVYWPGMKNTIRDVLKKCEICSINNRKNKGGCEFIETTTKLEKMGIDVLNIETEDKLVLVGIDYFTRYLFAEIIESRASKNVMIALGKWFNRKGVPEMIVSDNAKEFVSKEFKEFCARCEIDQRLVSVESHQSNGRIERAIRTIRDGLAKNRDVPLEENLRELITAYNNTYHEGIKCTPNEAWDDESGLVMIENSKQGSYNRRFKSQQREKFIVGERVRVAKRENMGKDSKMNKGRFVDMGKIIGSCEGDSYLVKMSDGVIRKKRHYDLKGLCETPSGGGDVGYLNSMNKYP